MIEHNIVWNLASKILKFDVGFPEEWQTRFDQIPQFVRNFPFICFVYNYGISLTQIKRKKAQILHDSSWTKLLGQ